MKNTIFSNYYDSEKEQHYREFMLEEYGSQIVENTSMLKYLS